jgi:hypothetical protein
VRILFRYSLRSSIGGDGALTDEGAAAKHVARGGNAVGGRLPWLVCVEAPERALEVLDAGKLLHVPCQRMIA